MKYLGQVANVRMGYPFRSRLEHDPHGAVAVLQMKDIDERGSLNLGGATRLNLPDAGSHHQLKSGDLIFRSRGRTNSVALIAAEPEPAVLAAPMLLIRPFEVLPAYLAWYINLPAVQATLAAQAEGTSVRMISKAALEALEVPVPNLRKQQLIVEASELAKAEQALLEQIARERKRLVDGVLMRYASNVKPNAVTSDQRI